MIAASWLPANHNRFPKFHVWAVSDAKPVRDVIGSVRIGRALSYDFNDGHDRSLTSFDDIPACVDRAESLLAEIEKREREAQCEATGGGE